jgi:transcriptional regulator with XRE-family HTH domain
MPTHQPKSDQDNKTTPTGDFKDKLFKSDNPEEFIQDHAWEMDPPPFHIYISNICAANGQVPEQVIKRAGIERTYGHQLFNGTRKPSREKVLQLAFGLQLNVDKTQRLLLIAQASALYPKIKRDAAILYCLEHKKDILELQSMLQSLGLTLLGSRKK